MNRFIFLAFSFFHFSLLATSSWDTFKNKTLIKMSSIPGWCSEEKAVLMMDLIKENEFQNCIEIGVFAGKSLFPIAQTLKYNNCGIVYAIDAWDPLLSIQGYSTSDPNYAWWGKVDYNNYYNHTLKLVINNKFNNFCVIIKDSSQNAATLFDNETIDFLHLDGNHNDEIVFQDILLYFPKIKNGGYILLNDPNWLSMMRVLVFLLERTDLASPFFSSANYLLFRKNDEKINAANLLINHEH